MTVSWPSSSMRRPLSGTAPHRPGRQEHSQDRLSGRRRDLDLTGWAEAVRDELDQLFEHTQCVKMGFIEAVEFFAILIDGGVLSIDKAEEVSRHCSYPVCLPCEPIYRANL